MLYSYKMKFDYGFAPNPFHKVLTLATCKPLLRETKKRGMYVAGFTSKKLCGDDIGAERLVYIMKISSTISFDDYFRSEEFQKKKYSNKNGITKVGDNIYFLENSEYQQTRGLFHRKREEIERDLKSKRVLIADEFFYFGSGAIPVKGFGINIPKTQTAYGIVTKDKIKIERLWNYLNEKFRKNTPLHPPFNWDLKEEFVSLKTICS